MALLDKFLIGLAAVALVIGGVAVKIADAPLWALLLVLFGAGVALLAEHRRRQSVSRR
jgi:membrane protein implicated in regulation of membrane protease activity